MSRYYSYQAVTPQGQRIQGKMQAIDRQNLAKQLLENDHYLIQARLLMFKEWDWHHYFIDTQRLQEFCFQLYLLLQAGIPLRDVLLKLNQQQSSRHLKIIIQKLVHHLNQGLLLSEALMLYPQLFDNTFISVVRTGEHIGKLADVFKKLATYLEWKNTLRQQLGRALIYPILLSCVMVGLLSVLMIVVVPELEHFIPQNDDSPFMTTSLLATARWLQNHTVIGFFNLIVAIFLVIVMRLLSKTFAQKLSFIVLKLPVIGPIIELINSEKFTNTMHVLLTAGIPLIDCIEQSHLSLKNLWLQQCFVEVHYHIQHGALLSEAIARKHLFAGLLSDIIATGEQSGELPQALLYAHHYVQQTLKRRLDVMITLIEPILILIIGLILIWIAVAIFVPLYDQLSYIAV